MKRGLLPENYREYKTVNLQQGRKTSLLIDLTRIGVLLGLGMAGVALLPSVLVPQAEIGIQVAVAVLGVMLCLLSHEWLHGLIMKIIGGGKLRYGFVEWISRMSSWDCFYKGVCAIILLMPWFLQGILLGVFQWWVGEAWDWVVFVIQVTNCVAAVTDIWSLAAILGQPTGARICLTDNQLIIYVPEDTGK